MFAVCYHFGPAEGSRRGSTLFTKRAPVSETPFLPSTLRLEKSISYTGSLLVARGYEETRFRFNWLRWVRILQTKAAY